MPSQWLSQLGHLNRHNYVTFRRSPLAEISGSLGDLGTLLPLMIALAYQRSIHLGSTLVFSGLFNILTGLVFGIPLPVQPMKVCLETPFSFINVLVGEPDPGCARLLPRPRYQVGRTTPWLSSPPPDSG